MLCGLCLVLAAGFDVRHQRDVDEQTVFPPGLDAYLADGLQKRGGFNVARGAADLRDNNVGIRLFPHGIDKAFDLARDMGNDLHRLAQIFAAAFFGEHVPVYLSRSEVGVLVQILVDKAFIMPQVQVGLRAVLGHEYLAVLIGAHGAGVYIDIRVQLLGRHLQTAAFQKAAKRGRRDALAQAGHHAARHKNILRHFASFPFLFPRARAQPRAAF